LSNRETVPVSELVNVSSKDMQLNSKTCFVAELVPSNRKLVEFSVEFATNTPGEMADVAFVLTRHQVNVMTGVHDAAKWSFFADVTEINSSVDEVVKEISNLASVRKVNVGKEQSEGFIVDSLHSKLTWGPFRSIVIRADVMSSILNRIKWIFGREGKAGQALVFGMGEAAGRAAYKGVSGQLSAEVIRSHLEDEMFLYMAQGWGEVKLASSDFDRGTARVQVFNSFECANPEGNSNSSCDFIRGHLTGLLSETFGRRVVVTETMCSARGHSHCQFDIEAKQA
jgi:predicted hydrocarbon binding protein